MSGLEVSRSGDIVTLLLNRPKVNALSVGLLESLRDECRRLAESPPGAVIVTGGPRVFAAGADISGFLDPDSPEGRVVPGGPQHIGRVGSAFLEALGALENLGCVTIAAVSGYALGGGCELALACDLRIASSRAVFGQPEILLGIIPGGGGTQRLARLIGPSRAKDLVFSGRQVGAEEALSLGLVNEVVPAEQLDDRVAALAAGFAAGPRDALRLAKKAIDEGLDGTLEAGLALEQRLFVDVFATDDAAVGIESFLEHGPGRARFGVT